MQIVSVSDKRIKKMVNDPSLTSVKGLDPFEFRRISDMIVAIRVMRHPVELTAFPQWKAHELKPGRPGVWALTVSGNYRLTFRVDIEAQEVHFLDYLDYH